MTLEEAVKAWVRAEYEFRVGKQAFDGMTQNWFEQASEELRKTLTGYPDLESAYRRLKGLKKRVYLTPDGQRRLNAGLSHRRSNHNR